MASTSNSFFEGKTILITGGTGTFGRAFVRKLLDIGGTKKIVIFSRDEFKQVNFERELGADADKVRFLIGDVRDLPRLERAFEGVDIVVHAAALKHVPVVEYNPAEAIRTNVLGTQNVVDAALKAGVDKVLFVSTDKAVLPINLYGATKLCAEKLIIAANAYRGNKTAPKFSVVRYGNVVGSRGSFIELIEKQRLTKKITLTHPEMTRFWIQISTVMDLVVEMLEQMDGGETFIPKMKSLKISDVIQVLAPECDVEVVGMRPGEKLHEMLISDHEASRAYDQGNFYAILPEHITWESDYSNTATETQTPIGLVISDAPAFLHAQDAVREILGIE